MWAYTAENETCTVYRETAQKIPVEQTIVNLQFATRIAAQTDYETKIINGDSVLVLDSDGMRIPKQTKIVTEVNSQWSVLSVIPGGETHNEQLTAIMNKIKDAISASGLFDFRIDAL